MKYSGPCLVGCTDILVLWAAWVLVICLDQLPTMYRQQHVWTHPTVLGESCKGPRNSIVNFVVPSVRSWPVTLKSIISCLVGSAIHSHRMVCHIMLRPLGEKNYWN